MSRMMEQTDEFVRAKHWISDISRVRPGTSHPPMRWRDPAKVSATNIAGAARWPGKPDRAARAASTPTRASSSPSRGAYRPPPPPPADAGAWIAPAQLADLCEKFDTLASQLSAAAPDPPPGAPVQPPGAGGHDELERLHYAFTRERGANGRGSARVRARAARRGARGARDARAARGRAGRVSRSRARGGPRAAGRERARCAPRASRSIATRARFHSRPRCAPSSRANTARACSRRSRCARHVSRASVSAPSVCLREARAPPHAARTPFARLPPCVEAGGRALGTARRGRTDRQTRRAAARGAGGLESSQADDVDAPSGAGRSFRRRDSSAPSRRHAGEPG